MQECSGCTELVCDVFACFAVLRFVETKKFTWENRVNIKNHLELRMDETYIKI